VSEPPSSPEPHLEAPPPRPLSRNDYRRVMNLIQTFHIVLIDGMPGQPPWMVLEEVIREQGGWVQYPADPRTSDARLGEELLAHELAWARTVLSALEHGDTVVVEWPFTVRTVCSEPGCPNLAVLDLCWRHQVGLGGIDSGNDEGS
jgi:hypothetical protein